MPRSPLPAMLVGLLLLTPRVPQAQASEAPFTWRTSMRSGAEARVFNMNGPIRVVRGGSTLDVTGTRRVRRGPADFVRFEARALAGGDVVVCVLWGPEQECTDTGVRGSVSMRRNGPEISADLVVQVPAGVRVMARTVNGDVVVDGATASVTASTVNGSATVEGATGATSLESVNGDVTARVGAGALRHPLRLSTVNGNVTLTLPSDGGARLEATTTNGSVSSDLPVTVQSTSSRRHMAGTLGTGGELIKLGTVNGNVRLRRGGA